MIRPSQRYFATEQLDPRLRAGLVGHWTGGGEGLTWFDRSGYGNHGTLTNGPRWTLGRDGRSAALTFDGTDDAVTVPAFTFSSAGRSICARFRSPDLTANRIILGDTSNNLPFIGFLADATKIQVRLLSTIHAFTFPAVEVNRWYHLVVTYNTAGQLYAYLNGIGSSASPSTDGNPASFTRIGSYTTATFGWNGGLDDLRFYNRVLSAAEISLLAQPDFLPIVPRRFSISSGPITAQAAAALATWFAPTATAQTRYTVTADPALSTWVAPSATAQLNRRRTIAISGSRSSYNISGSRASYHIEGS